MAAHKNNTDSRRAFLRQASAGLGALGLQGALGARALGDSAQQDQGTHFKPRAKRVIYLHMAGSPSQLDLFSEKPALKKFDGGEIPASFIENERFAFIKGVPKILASPYSFARHGESGANLSELLPHTAKVVDKLTFVHSMHTEQFNHGPAQIFLSTGSPIIGRPSFGSWLSYALGTENRDLPAFVVLNSGRYLPSGGGSCWGSGFLPSIHQGVRFRSHGDAVLFLSNPKGMPAATRKRTLSTLEKLNQRTLEESGDDETATRIAQYQLSLRMQSSVPELTDLALESEATRKQYGVELGKPSFASNALMARRLVERGVRFVQLYHWGWDNHGSNASDDILGALPMRCRETDQASAALVSDLEQRGLLEDTIVIWGGEFGRTPMNEERDGSKFLGRDHHPHAFTMWFAGGGFKPGVSHGETDELGYFITQNPVSIHDMHATLLHQLGIDHERLTFLHQGRPFRLTDVAGEVQRDLLA